MLQTVLSLPNPDIIGQSASLALALIRSPAFVPAGVAAILFESQYFMWAALALAAAAAIYRGVATQQPLARKVGIGMLVFDVLWIAASRVVDTPFERLQAAHQAILAATERADSAAITSYLSPDFAYGPLNRNGMQATLKTIFHEFPIRSNLVRLLKIDLSLPEATSHLNVLTTFKTNETHLTKWQIQWIDDLASDWRIRTVIPLEIDNNKVPADWQIPLAAGV